MLVLAELQPLGAGERFERIKLALSRSIESLLARDLELVACETHEQTICHRLALYLEELTDLNVDCEYNRDMLNAKMLKSGKPFRPDIIVHRRRSNDDNL